MLPKAAPSRESVPHTCLECAGLLNADNNDFVAGIIQTASGDFDRSLAAADTNRCRMLLRFFAALAGANVLHATSVLAAFQSIVDAASTFLETGKCTTLTPCQLWHIMCKMHDADFQACISA